MMDFDALMALGKQALEIGTRFANSYAGAKAALAENELAELNKIHDQIRAVNRKVAAEIDAAAAEAEKE